MSRLALPGQPRRQPRANGGWLSKTEHEGMVTPCRDPMPISIHRVGTVRAWERKSRWRAEGSIPSRFSQHA